MFLASYIGAAFSPTQRERNVSYGILAAKGKKRNFEEKKVFFLSPLFAKIRLFCGLSLAAEREPLKYFKSWLLMLERGGEGRAISLFPPSP